MLIAALVMAVIGLAALVTAVVTSNQVIAWVCIAASAIGVILLIVDALRERRNREVEPATEAQDEEEEEIVEPGSDIEPETEQFDVEYPDETVTDQDAERDSDPTETIDRANDTDRY